MKKLLIPSLVGAVSMFSSFCLAHSPLEDLPEIQNYTKSVQDWEKYQSYYRNQEIDVIDTHLHPGSFDKLGPKGKEFVLNVFPVNLPKFLKIPLLRFLSSLQLNPYGAFIGIKNECRKASATNCVLFATYAPETWGIEPNSDLLGYLDDSRNNFEDKTFFYGLASLSVKDWPEKEQASIDELRSALAHPKVVGIKLAFAHTLTAFDDTKYYKVYDIAEEFDKAVYHHVGTSPLRKVSDFDESEHGYLFRTFDPSYLEDAVKSYPNVRFVLGHAGNDANQEGFEKFDEVFALAEAYPNVYIEISALGSERNDPAGALMDSIMLRAKEANLVDRLVYGSDGPGNPGNIESYKDRVLASMERVGFSMEEAEKVMANNARAIFGIPE